jgi:hypothetical protein
VECNAVKKVAPQATVIWAPEGQYGGATGYPE